MATKKTPAPEDPAAPKPKRARKAGAAAGKAGKAHPDTLTTDSDRAFMGKAVLPIVERDGPLLLALAEKSFPGLKEPEKRFFRNLGIVDFGDELPDEKDTTRTLRADRLAWTLLDRRALRLLTPLGVNVVGARITGEMNLNYCNTEVRLALNACNFENDIILRHASFASLSLEGSECRGLHADGLTIVSGMFLRGKATFMGEVNLSGAVIGGNLECDSSMFINPGGYALLADGIKVNGYIFMRERALFVGSVWLMGARIDKCLECNGSTFKNLEGGEALVADGIKVNGSVFLKEGSKFYGIVRFVRGEVGGNFECDGSFFKNEKASGMALYADGIKVKGNVFLRGGCAIIGIADFISAEVVGHFIYIDMKHQKAMSLCLSHARVGVLWDDNESWPKLNKLWLDGFQYGRLDERAFWDLAARLDWLSRHGNSGRFNPQPYEQLAAVYREAGYEREAREVLIAKHWRWLEQSRCGLPALRGALGQWPGWPASWKAVLPWLTTTLPVWLGKAAQPCWDRAGKWLSWMFGKICAFGYKPWQAVFWWVGLWTLITWPAVSLMAEHGWLVPTLVDMQAGSLKTIEFTASGFSFDLLTPIFDMGYLSAWTPENNAAALILLVLGTVGYILVALFAASITGLIRK